MIGFKWGIKQIVNIITARYTFNSFVNALREHLQISKEVWNSNSARNGSTFKTDDETNYQ